MSKNKLLKRLHEDPRREFRFDYDPVTKVRSCRIYEMLVLNGCPDSIEMREVAADFWMSCMRKMFPQDILVVELAKYFPSQVISSDPTLNPSDDVAF